MWSRYEILLTHCCWRLKKRVIKHHKLITDCNRAVTFSQNVVWFNENKKMIPRTSPIVMSGKQVRLSLLESWIFTLHEGFHLQKKRKSCLYNVCIICSTICDVKQERKSQKFSLDEQFIFRLMCDLFRPVSSSDIASMLWFHICHRKAVSFLKGSSQPYHYPHFAICGVACWHFTFWDIKMGRLCTC